MLMQQPKSPVVAGQPKDNESQDQESQHESQDQDSSQESELESQEQSQEYDGTLSPTQGQLSLTSASRKRSKRPTPMDMAWRQVALDEKEGRIPGFVAETEVEKKMEQMSIAWGCCPRDFRPPIHLHGQRQRSRNICEAAQTAFVGACGASLAALSASLVLGGTTTIPKGLVRSAAVSAIASVIGAIGLTKKKKGLDRKINSFKFEDYIRAEKN